MQSLSNCLPESRSVSAGVDDLLDADEDDEEVVAGRHEADQQPHVPGLEGTV